MSALYAGSAFGMAVKKNIRALVDESEDIHCGPNPFPQWSHTLLSGYGLHALFAFSHHGSPVLVVL